jgi:UDP-glucose 4-epimerase
MKVLVTGGAGFIGSTIANTLGREKNTTVVAFDDLSLGRPTNLSGSVKFVKGSVMDYNLTLDIGKGCDYIFHSAAKSSSPMFKNDPREGVDINTLGFMNVMESAKRNRAKKVIFASSSSMYNGLPTPFKESQVITPKTFYEASFYCREILARSYYLENDLNSVGLRYFSVYGFHEKHKGKFANNISQFLWSMTNGESPIIYGDGTQTRDFTFVDDVVQANILALQSEKMEFGIYNIGTGIETSFSRVVEIINQGLGTDIKATYVGNPIKNYVQKTKADISLAKSELGYEPKCTVDDGIQTLIKNQNARYNINLQ